MLDLFEFSSGQRMHTRYFQIGGVFEDIPVGFAAKLKAFVEEMPSRADQYADLLEKNEIVLERLRHPKAVCSWGGAVLPLRDLGRGDGVGTPVPPS